jgi:hypothetical protein
MHLFHPPHDATAPAPASRAAKPRHGDQRFGLGHWVLTVHTDPFDGRVSCTLAAPRMEVSYGAVVFHFEHYIDTFPAEYRIDAGPGKSWRVNAAALAARGVALQTDDAVNPSGGKVAIPLSEVLHAEAVWIRPSVRERHARFLVGPLKQMVEAAGRLGCGPEIGGREQRLAPSADGR